MHHINTKVLSYVQGPIIFWYLEKYSEQHIVRVVCLDHLCIN
jgi:hypothetical protein